MGGAHCLERRPTSAAEAAPSTTDRAGISDRRSGSTQSCSARWHWFQGVKEISTGLPSTGLGSGRFAHQALRRSMLNGRE